MDTIFLHDDKNLSSCIIEKKLLICNLQETVSCNDNFLTNIST